MYSRFRLFVHIQQWRASHHAGMRPAIHAGPQNGRLRNLMPKLLLLDHFFGLKTAIETTRNPEVK